MRRSTKATLAALVLVLGTTGSAQVMQPIDEWGMAFASQPPHELTVARAADGRALLIDESTASPRRVASLGFVLPPGPASARFQALPELGASADVAISTTTEVRLFRVTGFPAARPLVVERLGVFAIDGGIEPDTARVERIDVRVGTETESNALGYFITDADRIEAFALLDGALVPVRFFLDLDGRDTYVPLP